jgi:hypothetical protein
MADRLGRMNIKRLTGNERFSDSGRSLGSDLLRFWQWSMSDLMSNAARGVVAEYVVAMAMGVDVSGVRDEWAAYDLCTDSGIKIEVKSAAYLQSWYQSTLSKVTFSVQKTRAWDADTNVSEKRARRQADVYVFALLAHRDKATVNPMDVGQWEFFVLPTSVLNVRGPSQHSISESSLRRIAGAPHAYMELAIEVAKASRENGKRKISQAESLI